MSVSCTLHNTIEAYIKVLRSVRPSSGQTKATNLSDSLAPVQQVTLPHSLGNCKIPSTEQCQYSNREPADGVVSSSPSVFCTTLRCKHGVVTTTRHHHHHHHHNLHNLISSVRLMSARALYPASASTRLQVAVFRVVLLHFPLGFDPQGLDFNTDNGVLLHRNCRREVTSMAAETESSSDTEDQWRQIDWLINHSKKFN